MISNLEEENDDGLVESYNRISRRGLIAAHGQVLYLLSMRRAFMRRFNASPIEFVSANVLRIRPNEITIQDMQNAAGKPTDYDQQMLWQMRRDVKYFGKMKSKEVIDWWNEDY